MQNECAPREFEYELSELSAGTRVELMKGEVRFINETGHGVKIEAPWVMDAKGERRTGVVRWELQERKGEAKPLLRLVHETASPPTVPLPPDAPRPQPMESGRSAWRNLA